MVPLKYNPPVRRPMFTATLGDCWAAGMVPCSTPLSSTPLRRSPPAGSSVRRRRRRGTRCSGRESCCYNAGSFRGPETLTANVCGPVSGLVFNCQPPELSDLAMICPSSAGLAAALTVRPRSYFQCRARTPGSPGPRSAAAVEGKRVCRPCPPRSTWPCKSSR